MASSSSEAPENHPPQTPPPTFIAYVGNGFVFALAASLIITILGFGLRIIQHGLPVCKLLADEGLLARMLYTSCGCATVEIILLAFALPVGWFTGRRLVRHLVLIAKSRRHFGKRQTPQDTESSSSDT